MKSVYAELKPELDAAYARVMEFGLVRARQGSRGLRGRVRGVLRHPLLRRSRQRARGAGTRPTCLEHRRRRRGHRAVQHLHRHVARGDGGRRQGRAGRADAGWPQYRSRPSGGRDYAAHPGDHAGASLRRAGRHGCHRRAREQAWAESRRGRGAGAGLQSPRPARRFAGAGGRAQFFPDEEHRRLRRRRCGHDRRSRDGRSAACLAQLRQQGEVREHRAGLQLAARRDAGGLPARETAASRSLERAAPHRRGPLRRHAGRHSRPRVCRACRNGPSLSGISTSSAPRGVQS